MELPSRGGEHDPADYLDVIARAVFRGGMSRQVVDAKWPAIREAFRGFDPAAVASLTNAEVEELLANPGVIRNRRKIEAVVANARRLVEIGDQYGGLDAYLKTLPDFDAKFRALRSEFKHLGDFGGYFVLYVIGEDVPPYEEWTGRAS